MSIDEESMFKPVAEGRMEETSPLLSTSPLTTPPTWKGDRHQYHRRAYVVIFFLLTAVNLGVAVFEPAQARLFESVYCRAWYQEHDPALVTPGGVVAEVHCKIPPVQRDVASLTGWKQTLDVMPALFLAIPFGILADKYGRKWLLFSNVLCILCRYSWVAAVCFFANSSSIRLVWLGTMFNFVSGGNIVAESLFCTILSDITPRQLLANAFFAANAVGTAASVVGPIMCASLMRKNIWYPIWLGLALQTVSVLAALALPETLTGPDSAQRDRSKAPDTACLHDSSTDVARAPPEIKNSVYLEMATSVKALSIIFGDWRMAALAGLYPVRMMYHALQDLLPRYISYRYKWSFASATYLFSLQALGTTLCLFILLPFVSDHLDKGFKLGAIQKNVVLARLSLGMLSLGLLLQGLAPSISTLICGLLVGTLGAGVSSVLRALAGSLVDHKDNGKVFSGLAVAETISWMAAFPAVAGMYNAGIQKGGGAWLGMPFDITGIVLGLSAVVLCFLKFGTSSQS